MNLPFLYLARCGLFHTDNLVAVEQAEGVKGQFQLDEICHVSFVMMMTIVEMTGSAFFKTYPAHRIHSRLAQLVGKIIALDETNAVLASHGAFHLHSALDHAMDNTLGDFLLLVAEKDDG